ncbi:MAG: NTP transferase domain-containing protein, partial [Dokdonella sp.]|uniref:NTP transferase domain-containing protein n=1 Tax=Dokdonella sp. TaxID=2291710 RepID=UPI003263B6AB
MQDTRIIAADEKGARAGPSGPTLVVLAAGLGRRFGGEKQIAAVGPAGEWLIEYTIRDALAAGFTRLVLVIRETMREAIARRLMPHLAARAELVFVEQTLQSVPEGCVVPSARHKPMGTGHALWCCHAVLDRPFAVVNADDCYGHTAFALLAGHFARAQGPAMVGYRLDRTVSEHGGVNRGLCAVDADGQLADIAEYTDIRAGDDGLSGLDPHRVRQPLASGAIVSLNCWGLLPDLL